MSSLSFSFLPICLSSRLWDAVPLPEREVSSLPSLFPRLPPQAAQVRYLKNYLL